MDCIQPLLAHGIGEASVRLGLPWLIVGVSSSREAVGS